MHVTIISNLLRPMIHCEARTLVYLEIQTGHVLVDIPVLAQKLKLKLCAVLFGIFLGTFKVPSPSRCDASDLPIATLSGSVSHPVPIFSALVGYDFGAHD